MSEKSLYEQMLDTAAGCRLNVISETHAAQLMAVMYAYGDENGVYSDKMRTDIRHVALTHGIYGGGLPEPEFIKKVSRCAAELLDGSSPLWLKDFEERYGITLNTEL